MAPDHLFERRLLSRVGETLDRRRIAVIGVRGVIGGGMRGPDTLRALDNARRADHVRAVLLVIDSPGGGATASEVLYAGVRRLAAVKPVVAWIAGTGASGAYYLACGATRVLAFPSAIVGSIGVISIRPLISDALQRIGAAVMVTTTGPFKDLGAPWRVPSDADRAKERELVDAIFVRFRDAVGGARGLDAEALARVTSGEVWIGTDAQQLGLVDALAESEDDALTVAQDLAGLPHRRTLRFGQRRTILQRLGVPGAGMGPPGPRWITELEGWLSVPRARA